MKKQTAVEWLYSRLNVCTNRDECADLLYKLELQAKEMEQEQIINAFIEAHEYEHGDEARAWFWKDAVKYYNETYGGEE